MQPLTRQILNHLLDDLNWCLQAIRSYRMRSMPQNTPPQLQNSPQSTVTPQNPDTLLPWEFNVVGSENNRHNVRVLCDLEALSFDLKEDLVACVKVESDFDTGAIHKNFAIKEVTVDGQTTKVKYLSSTDRGLCQWNDHYHGTEITPDQAFNDPEFAVRLMCRYFLAGRQSEWVSFSSGEYLQWKGKV